MFKHHKLLVDRIPYIQNESIFSISVGTQVIEEGTKKLDYS